MSHRAPDSAPASLSLSRFAAGLLFCASLLCIQPPQACAATNPNDATGSSPNPIAASSTYQNLPLSFERNAGQTSSTVEFLSRGPGYALFLTRAGAVIRFSDAAGNVVLRMNPVAANPKLMPIGQDELPGRINYIRGNDPKKWTTNVPTYGAVRYPNLYPGIDMIYSGKDRRLEYSFVLAPQADERQIEMRIDGADDIRISENGDLLIRKAERTISFAKPIAYEMDANSKADPSHLSGPLPTTRLVQAKYLLDHHRVRFSVQHRDPSRVLVIDPTLSYSTYVGGSSEDYGTNVWVDSSGNAYAAGYTDSIDFPITAGSFQTSCGGGCTRGNYDGYVLKMNPAGTALIYATYLGGSANESLYGLFVDSAGDAYVVGQTGSSDFPVTAGAFQTTCNGGCANPHGFITELNPTGSGLIYSTYLGGTGIDRVDAIVVDSSGNAYVTGGTQSTDFPITPGVFQTTCHCSSTSDAFVAEMNPTGTSLIYSSYLGGSSADLAYSIAVDADGDAFLTGYTQSSDFPVTTGAFQTTINAPVAAFVTKVSPGAKSLIYSTYLGGSSGVQGNRVCYTCGTSVVVDGNGNALVTGLTLDTDFPTTPGAYQTTLHGTSFGHDAFVTNLNSSGTGLLYSTLLGGSSDDGGTALVLDSSGNIYLRGNTLSTDFPVTPGAVQSTLGGSYDAFIAEFDPTLSNLLYSTYLGGQLEEFGMATHNLALDSQSPPNIFVTGYTLSTNFPTTAGAFQLSNHGLYDAFLSKISPSPNVSLSTSSVNFGNQQVGTTSAPQIVTLTNVGNLDLDPPVFLLTGANKSDFAQTNTCSSALAPQSSCSITLTFTPSLSAAESAGLSITDNAPGSPQTISLSGTGVSGGPAVTLSPTQLTFPQTVLKTSSAPMSVTLTNTGSQPLNITSIALSGDFTQTNTCGSTVNAGNSCMIGVTFTPTLPNTRTGTVTITDNAINSPQTISLTGVGTAIQLSPSALNFGSVPVGTSSSPQTVNVTNVGGAAVNFKQITFTGKDPANYSETNNCLPSIAAGAGCSVSVTFTPTATGLRPASLSLTDNGGGSSQAVPLSGTGK